MSHQAKIPEKSAGLGGLAISVGRPEHLLGGGRAWHRANESAPRALAKNGVALPGEMSFSAPFSDLGHEWIHALDARAASWAAGQPPARRLAFGSALSQLRETLLFERAATAQDAAQYIHAIQRETRKMIWTELVEGELMDFIGDNAQSPFAERAADGLLPSDFARQFHPVWAACKTGSEKTIARAVGQLLSYYCEPRAASHENDAPINTGDAAPKNLGEWSRLFARDLRDSVDAERKAKQMMRENPHWGPMRWAALLEDRAQWKSLRVPYWATPDELRARGAEVFFAQSGIPELGWVETEGHLQPQGDERGTALSAFSRFFEQARPEFNALAESLGAQPAHQLREPPSLGHWRKKSAVINDKSSPVERQKSPSSLSMPHKLG